MGRLAVAPRALLALGAAAAISFSGPVLVGPVVDRSMGFVALGHSQLASSQPGAGETLAAPPTEIRLVFSEPIDPGYTSLDLLDGTGRAVLLEVGGPDPTDPHMLVAAIPPGTTMPLDSLYTVDWRALSAADGHTTQGFLAFGVGKISIGGQAAGGPGAADIATGELHGGHSGGAAAAEIQGKVLAYGGAMLAFGLAILAWLVLRPALGQVPRGMAYGSGIGLVAGAAGCVLLLVVGASFAHDSTVTTAPITTPTVADVDDDQGELDELETEIEHTQDGDRDEQAGDDDQGQDEADAADDGDDAAAAPAVAKPAKAKPAKAKPATVAHDADDNDDQDEADDDDDDGDQEDANDTEVENHDDGDANDDGESDGGGDD